MREYRYGGNHGWWMALAAVVVVSAGCGAHRPAAPHGNTTAALGEVTSTREQNDLENLAHARAALPAGDGYRVGGDDLLDVRIPDLVEAGPLTAAARNGGTNAGPGAIAAAPVYQDGLRVSAAGDVNLPFLGRVHVAGLTTAQIERDLARRLIAAHLLRTPQVSVQIAEYRSRVVAVIGSVEHPGLYPVTKPGATVADLVWMAGGPSKDAGRLVEFAPGAQDGAHSAGPPVRLDLQVMLHASGADAAKVNPRIAPGDVISVPPAGNVLVSGWVDKPGSYPVTRGLTVSGAVAAAGGTVFAADENNVTVHRVLAPGEERTFTIDLRAVAEGRALDLALADGDVVTLPAAPTRVVPWAMWTVTKEMVHIGGNVLLF